MEDIQGFFIAPSSDSETIAARPDRRSKRQNPGLVPERLLGLKSICPKCHNRDKIKWVDELSYPGEPILNIPSGKYFVPVSFPVACSACSSEYHVPVPERKSDTTWHLYGDEGHRIIERNGQTISFMCLTLSCLHRDKYDLAQQRFAQLKRQARPDTNPEDWVHHFTDIWSTSTEKEKYSFKNKNQKIEYGLKYAHRIKKLMPYLQIFVYTSAIVLAENLGGRKASLKYQKEELFKRTIVTSLDLFRGNRSTPSWTFDNIQDASNGPKREGWAEECFLGLQYTPLFMYLSSGVAVHAPKFVKPGSHLLLEISDFISFILAREFMLSAQGKAVEIPSGRFGPATFNMVKSDGDIFTTTELGSFAIQRFFGK